MINQLLIGLIIFLSAQAAQAQDKVGQNCAQLGFKQGTKGYTDCMSSGNASQVAQSSVIPAPSVKTKAVTELTTAQREEKFWDDAKAIGNKEAFEGYLVSYPTGRYVSLAKASILRLSNMKISPAQDATSAECLGNPSSWNNCVGTQTLVSGGKFVGEFKEGKRNGQGTYTWPDGQKYVGEFKEGKRSGQGTDTLPDGTKYIGEWKEDKANGQGTRTWSDGAKYTGEWIDGKRSGLGTFLWPDGSKHVGEFRDGKISGKGTRTWPDGAKYVGEFVDEKRNGQGSMMRPDGSLIYSGLWTDGKPDNSKPSVQQRTLTPKQASLEARCREYGFVSNSAAIAQCMLQLDQAEQKAELQKKQRAELESRCALVEAQAWLTTTGGFAEGAQRATASYSACMDGLPPPSSGRIICRREGPNDVYCFNQ